MPGNRGDFLSGDHRREGTGQRGATCAKEKETHAALVG
jgi:hypothetical protein